MVRELFDDRSPLQDSVQSGMWWYDLVWFGSLQSGFNTLTLTSSQRFRPISARGFATTSVCVRSGASRRSSRACSRAIPTSGFTSSAGRFAPSPPRASTAHGCRSKVVARVQWPSAMSVLCSWTSSRPRSTASLSFRNTSRWCGACRSTYSAPLRTTSSIDLAASSTCRLAAGTAFHRARPRTGIRSISRTTCPTERRVAEPHANARYQVALAAAGAGADHVGFRHRGTLGLWYVPRDQHARSLP